MSFINEKPRCTCVSPGCLSLAGFIRRPQTELKSAHKNCAQRYRAMAAGFNDACARDDNRAVLMKYALMQQTRLRDRPVFIKLRSRCLARRTALRTATATATFRPKRLRIVRKAHNAAGRAPRHPVRRHAHRAAESAALAEAAMRKIRRETAAAQRHFTGRSHPIFSRYFLCSLALDGARRMRRVYRRQRLAHVQSGVHATPAIRRRRPASDRQALRESVRAGRHGRGACRGWPRW